MKVYTLTDTSYGMNNSIIGIFTSELLAKEFATIYCTPVNGEMDEDDKLSLSLMVVSEYELDIKFIEQ